MSSATYITYLHIQSKNAISFAKDQERSRERTRCRMHRDTADRNADHLTHFYVCAIAPRIFSQVSVEMAFLPSTGVERWSRTETTIDFLRRSTSQLSFLVIFVLANCWVRKTWQGYESGANQETTQFCEATSLRHDVLHCLRLNLEWSLRTST